MSLRLHLDSTAVRTCPVSLLSIQRPEVLAETRRHAPTLVRVRPGWYAPASTWSTLAPWDRYLARVHAAARSLLAPVFSHESAAALLGLPVFGEPKDIHVIADQEHSRRRGDVLMHATSAQRLTGLTDGIIVTAVAETTIDLGRVLTPAFAMAVVDAALRRLDTVDGVLELRRMAARSPNRRGTRQLSWLWPRADARSESPGESVSRVVIAWLGYPAPELQVTFDADGERRVDFYWREARVIGEFDGLEKYDTPQGRDALIAEKRREDTLRRQARGFVRWEWADVLLPERLDAKLRAAGLTPIRPADIAGLASLRRNPRSR